MQACRGRASLQIMLTNRFCLISKKQNREYNMQAALEQAFKESNPVMVY